MGRASPSLTLSDILSKAERDALRFRVLTIDEADVEYRPEAADKMSIPIFHYFSGNNRVNDARNCQFGAASGLITL